MKLSQVLNRQHIGFMFKKHWMIQGKRIPINTKTEEYLKSKGIPVQDALEFVKEEPHHERVNIIGPYEPAIPLDENHPDYKRRPCYTLHHSSVLLEGLFQAQILTKTIIAEDKLPTKIEELADKPSAKAVHECVKKAILSANVFDCEQEKLPKIKDPKRPAFNFPRILGITDRRRNQVLTNKLIQLIERSSDTKVTQTKLLANDVECSTVFNKENNLIQFKDVSHILVASKEPVKHKINEKDVPFVEIPDLYPVKYTVTMPKEHFYSDTSEYPINPNISIQHPHTTWLHFNRTEVGNIYETPITPVQILGRSLTHAFTVASAYAKQLHGEDVKDLPEPIYINCIQTDGQNFHFGILELNTLNVDGTDGIKNVWYCKNDMKMYDSSRYFGGMPVLENYNPKVYEYLNAFYNC